MELIEAEFNEGVLRPMRRLRLRPGERVGLIVVRRPDPSRWNLALLSKVTSDEDILTEAGLAEWATTLGREDRPREQTGRRPVVIWQSDTLTRALQSVLVVPLTTNLDRARLAGTAMIEASDNGLSQTSVALAFQMRAVPKACLLDRIRNLTENELGELELATDEALGRVEPKPDGIASDDV